MRNIIKTLAALGTLLTLSIVPMVSAQQSNCSISNTGADSNNTCTISETNTVTVTCVNGVHVTNLNTQVATTGTAVVSGNTISATATTGNATNNNELAQELSVNCALASVKEVPSAVKTANHPTGGKGAGATTVQVLARTGNSSLIADAAIGAAGILALAAVTQLGLAGYRRSIK